MRAQYIDDWYGGVAMVAGLSVRLHLLGPAQGQERPAEPVAASVALVEASRLSAQVTTLYNAGQYRAAIPLAQRVFALREQALGPTHPEVAITLNNLAGLYQTQGDVARAVAVRRRGMDLDEHTLASLLTTGAEAQKQAYLATLAGTTWATVSLHTQAAPQGPEALHLALTTVLRRKGRILDAMTDTLATLRRHLEPADQVLLAQWQAACTLLATLLLRGPGEQDPTGYRQHIAHLEAQTLALEAQLSARSAAFRAQTAPVTLAAVQQHLPPEAALVEMVWYRPFEPRAASPTATWGAARYVAYVVRTQGPPRWVDWGEAASIDRAILRLQRELSCAAEAALPAPERYRRRLEQARTYARQLDEQLMRPLLPLLGDARRLLLVPDGTLNLLSFGALVDEQQRYQIERFTINYLTSGRDVLRGPTPVPRRQRPLEGAVSR